MLMDEKTGVKKENVKDIEKKEIIYKALENGWEVKKVNDKTYSFRRKKLKEH